MALNFPGPYEVRLFYTTNQIEHVAKYNCNLFNDPGPGTPFSGHSVLQQGGGNQALNLAVEAWLDIIKPRFSAADTVFNRAELWKYTPGTFDAQFYASYTPTAQPTSASPHVPANQDILTFRSSEGGVMKVAMMQTIQVSSGKFSYPTANSSINVIFEYITGINGWFLARDTSYPISSVNWLAGQNEALFKRIYR